MKSIGIRRAFWGIFGDQPAVVVRAPGRVNLMGGHTDYNEGYVLPVAIDRSVMVAASLRRDRRVVIHALDFGQRTEFPLDAIERDEEQAWSNYQRGVAHFLQQEGFELLGLNACISGDVPIGSGLSSSAAVEVAIAYTWRVLCGLKLDMVKLALLCQRAENEFVGMSCGIMDQLISALGRQGCAMLIDCRSLAHEFVPLPSSVAIVVSDTMVRRELVSSEYNLRRRECEEGVRLLRSYLPGIRALRDISPAQFERYAGKLPEVVRKRCRHVVYENQRVLEGAEALRKGDLARFGQLMNESHASLRDDYEVSCRELEVIAEAAQEVEGAYGTRITGAGFGGCTVSLVDEEAVEDFRRHVAEKYEAATGIVPQIYACHAEGGVSTMSGPAPSLS